MQWYPRYGFEHFQRLHTWEGGLTFEQFVTLYKHAAKRDFERFKTLGIMLGCQFDEDKDEGRKPKVEPGSFFKFGDPESYENMPPEEREELTQKMRENHRPYVTKWTEHMADKKVKIGGLG